MLVSADNELRVSWQDYDHAIEALALKVFESGWKFDVILCLARGGLRPGDVFSRIFGLPLAILSTSSYREEAGTVQGALDIARHVTVTAGSVAGKVLLIDDLVDSGATLHAVKKLLDKSFPAVTEVRSAVIWYKACSVIRPDYHLEFLETNPWIRQPFEFYDGMRPEQLAARIKQGHSI